MAKQKDANKTPVVEKSFEPAVADPHIGPIDSSSATYSYEAYEREVRVTVLDSENQI